MLLESGLLLRPLFGYKLARRKGFVSLSVNELFNWMRLGVFDRHLCEILSGTTGTAKIRNEKENHEDGSMRTDKAWDLTKPTMPARSRLYSLEPIGVGTPATESLTSYVIRLAEAHRVEKGVLISKEVRPLLGDTPIMEKEDAYTIEKMAWMYPPFLYSVEENGIGKGAAKQAQALEQLTLRTDLHYLTLQLWPRRFHPSGIILRPQQAWCPVCFEEWQAIGHPIYYPLLWTLNWAEICPQHLEFLWDRCPHEACQRSFHWGSINQKLGYCPICGGWLGLSAISSATEVVPFDGKLEQHQAKLKVAELLGKSIAVMPLEDLLQQVTEKSAQIADSVRKRERLKRDALLIDRILSQLHR